LRAKTENGFTRKKSFTFRVNTRQRRKKAIFRPENLSGAADAENRQRDGDPPALLLSIHKQHKPALPESSIKSLQANAGGQRQRQKNNWTAAAGDCNAPWTGMKLPVHRILTSYFSESMSKTGGAEDKRANEHNRRRSFFYSCSSLADLLSLLSPER